MHWKAGVNIKQNIKGYSVVANQISKKFPRLKIQTFIVHKYYGGDFTLGYPTLQYPW